MEAREKRSVSAFFVAAFILACIFVGATVQNNREISSRRLVSPVQTVGTLEKSYCTTFTRGGGKGGTFNKPHIVLEYRYATVSANLAEHVLVGTRGFDTSEECEAYQRSVGKSAPVWYEEAEPKKASLYKYESYQWGMLYGLILVVLFVVVGVYDQRGINRQKGKRR
jgi:hypothetical protein